MEGVNPAIEPGRPWPMGASVRDGGVNVAVYSQRAQAVELCLFDTAGTRELQRLRLPGRTHDVFHGFVPGAGAGLVYGLRAHGPWQPERGHRFDARKLLLDPWARDIVGRFEWRTEHVEHGLDNTAHALKARVVDERGAPGADTRPHVPVDDTVIYELHVRGFTRLHPGVPEPLRGSYAGLASEAAVSHLRRLGVTTLCLLPVHRHLDERRLVERGLVNYWGYNTLGYFCPEPRYAAGDDARAEFGAMVQTLHAAGLEVMLDVVFNHTAETDEFGPTLSWRGLDNAGWYRLRDDDPARYENWAGCGNVLDLRRPRVLQFVMDSLRWWATRMNVDGFRFDLAPVLARGEHGFDAAHALLHAIAQDPQLAGLKLVAEPWDLGPGGYRLGEFPPGWMEWNDRFRDTARRFWLGRQRGMPVTRGEFALRLAGSADVFGARGRTPAESVNYVVSHDGFTLADAVAHDRRHNEANGEGGLDGPAHEPSWNCGSEGPSDDPAVVERRARLQRALLATLLLAQGTPMLAAGMELGHTQRGNNNPYCQDNAITWIDWARVDRPLLDFSIRLLALRRELRPFGPRWYEGDGDLSWWRADGARMSTADWQQPDGTVFGALVSAPGRAPGPLLALFNAGETAVPFELPAGRWHVRLDSARADAAPHAPARSYPLAARSVVLLQAQAPAAAGPHDAAATPERPR